MKKIISVLTATRAEYGLLKPILTKLMQAEELEVRIAVTGMHLSQEFGLTYQEIEKDGFAIDRKIDILTSADTPASVSKAMGRAIAGFGEYFSEAMPDLFIVLGDRYETLAACCAAAIAGIPIAHLYGGETTEGAIDESIRHAITKLSYLHFTSTEEYRKRVIQLGEAPDRVYTVGAVGIENINNLSYLSKAELEDSLGFCLDKPFALVTYHPETLEKSPVEDQFQQLLSACDEIKALKYIFTKANADAGGSIINHMIDSYTAARANTIAVTSLGSQRYLSAMKYCSLVLGNSSSGLLEAPSFGVPTVNIGDRQRGRLQSSSVINCSNDKASIQNAIMLALTDDWQRMAKSTVNPYGDGNTSERVVRVILEYLLQDRILLKKSFYNINFEVKP